MIGWHVSVSRQAADRRAPATGDTERGARIAVWQTGSGGLGWIDALVREGRALNLGGNGYPYRYTAPARHLLPAIEDGPPEARDPWVHGSGDMLGEDWSGRTVIDRPAARDCPPDEWLVVEAWDES
ncbi:hypothetical protein [Miltoncostaea oceani]|uniref:hypothetical protein n=1 Tax=Miltoncostaea oceani TaxID=2843216 RepID=UPI001C3E2A7E|nr:hypothetical protein [Miltoncostaea oceani]